MIKRREDFVDLDLCIMYGVVQLELTFPRRTVLITMTGEAEGAILAITFYDPNWATKTRSTISGSPGMWLTS